ncbi:MAG: energy transducer TonB [Candidatus Acidiferrales bacterium]
MRRLLPICLCFLSAVAVAITTPAQSGRTIPLSDAVNHALGKSQLTLPGSAPFHIKISISETTNPRSERHAGVEEYWLSPEKYRRTIQSPAFSQTLIVNGSAVSETDTGDYYPYWLYQLVTAVFDPIPFAAQLQDPDRQIAEPSGNEKDQVCSDIHMTVDRIVICFSGNRLLESVFTKGYFAEFRDYQKFSAKQVPRRIVSEPEYKSEIVASITALDPLPQPDESMFEVKSPTPPAGRIQIVRIDENVMRNLVIGGAEIAWPAVVSGKESGGCGAFISADRNGNVREEFPEGCDNTALEEPLHEALLKWKLKQAVVKGVPVQVTALMGFPFKVQVGSAPPSVSTANSAPPAAPADNSSPPPGLPIQLPKPPVPNATPTRIRVGGNVAAAKLVHQAIPIYPQDAKSQGISGTVLLHCVIAKDGTMLQIDYVSGPPLLMQSAIDAVRQWRYQPTLLNHVPVEVDTTISVIYTLDRMP